MTHTDPTAAALLRAILLCPADDTARLVFADWLDEHAGTSGYTPCPECKGEGRPSRQYPLLCRKCGGTGLVPASNGFAERAEFIRAQVFGRGLLGTAQACPHCVDGARLGDVGTGAPPRCTECCGTGSRYAREWGGIPCPACGDVRAKIGGFVGACALCDSSGLAPVEFRRGFVERVRCRMGDVLRFAPLASAYVSVEHTPMAWTLTPWAAGVLAAHPVTAWEITDEWEPRYDMDQWGWEEHHLPAPVIQELGGENESWFDTPELARAALALAVGRVARRLAGLPEVKP